MDFETFLNKNIYKFEILTFKFEQWKNFKWKLYHINYFLK